MKNSTQSLAYCVSETQVGKKLIDFLVEDAKLSRRFCKAATKDRRLRINGKSVTLGERVKLEDTIEVLMEVSEETFIAPEPMELSIVFEDKDILIIDKPPFLLVHPTKNHPSGTLANGIKAYYMRQQEEAGVRFVSRLDRDTSGLILVAKNSFSHMKLGQAMEEQSLIKKYVGIIEGNMNPVDGKIDLPIGKNINEPIKQEVRDDGLPSVTLYKTLKTYLKGALVEYQLLTGRTHQIRVHSAYFGHPLMGDSLYGEQEKQNHVLRIKRQALHAYFLSFPHPRTDVIMEFNSPIPKDMLQQMQWLEDGNEV